LLVALLATDLDRDLFGAIFGLSGGVGDHLARDSVPLGTGSGERFGSRPSSPASST
jgi:hypothetical protein